MPLPAWFLDVKAVFDSYGVPLDVWVPIMQVESGGNPAAVGDNGCSIGLFQANMCGGQGAGHSRERLLDPVYNARVVAPQIAAAVRRCGADDMTCIVANSQRPAASSYPLYEQARARFEQLGRDVEAFLSAAMDGGGAGGDVGDTDECGPRPSVTDPTALAAWLECRATAVARDAAVGAVRAVLPIDAILSGLQEARYALVLGGLGLLFLIIGALGFVAGGRTGAIAQAVAEQVLPAGRVANAARAIGGRR